jgi:LysM repeat protein
MLRAARVTAILVLSASTISLSGFTAHADGTASTYVVKSGDSLSGISSKLGVSLSSLLTTNNLTAKSVILPGATLKVPGGGVSPFTYTVKAGDSLGKIASRQGVSLASLLEVNSMTAKSLITPGMSLKLPAGANAPSGTTAGATGGTSGTGGAPAASGATYTIKAGDSLGGIAARSGVSLGALLTVNGMTAKSLILPGMTLKLPAGSTAPEQGNTASGPGGSYTVLAGDSLGGIASRAGVSLGALLKANNMTVTSLILPGMALALPAGAQVVAANSNSALINQVLDFALSQQGKPYKFFTKGPATYDCSGLALAAYAQIGVKLIHQSAAQAMQGTPIDHWSQPIRPGDLVFMKTNGSSVINHVGIALSSTTWIQARRPGDVVRVGPMPAKSLIVAVSRFVTVD